MNEEVIIKKGIVVNSFRGSVFDVQLEDGFIVKAYIAGGLRKFTKIIKGDEVMVKCSTYEPANGIICERLTKIPVINVVHKKKKSQLNRVYKKK